VNNCNKITVSSLNKTWLLDLDGTVFFHNSYIEGEDKLIDGVKEFFEKNIREEDYVIGLTSRRSIFKEITMKSIKKHSLKIDQVIFNLPYGERIIINDKKPSGLITAVSLNITRDKAIDTEFIIDENL